MKIRSLLFALSTVALATPVFAQDAPDQSRQYEIPELPAIYRLEARPGTEAAPKPGGSLMEESGYVWFSRHFARLSPDDDNDGFADFDSNRINLPMPFVFPNNGPEMRGYGQIFAPGIIYNTFKNLTSDTVGLVYNDVYYEQFKDAGSFTIDSIITYWFKNPNAGTPFVGAKFLVFHSPAGVVDKTYFGSTATTGYQKAGMAVKRSNLPIVFEAEITPEGIDTTINGAFINPLKIEFTEPLSFEAGSFAIPFIVNDEAEALLNPGGQTDVRDFQIMASFWERRQGEVSGFGANKDWMSMAVGMYRPNGEFSIDKDTVYSLHKHLYFRGTDNTSKAAVVDTWMRIYGVVDLNAGVKYYYGTEASSQGLGSAIPNPASVDARIPFTLTEVAHVSLDLYDVNGTHIRSLLDNRYVPGVYSAPLATGDLANGTYLVRMVAGEKVYSMKVTVAK